MENRTRKLVLIAILLSLSIVVNIVERFALQGLTGMPWVRLGLANIIVLLVLYAYGLKDGFAIMLLRILLVAILTTGLGSVNFFLSLSGGILSFVMMVIFKYIPGFSLVSVSVMGALGHSTGQILMAMFLLATDEIIFTLPVLMVISVPTGVFVGLVTQRVLSMVGPTMNITSVE